MFRITLLPAAQGDAIWIEYGNQGGAVHRVLIDGGVHATGAILQDRIEDLPVEERVFDLAVVTHVDLDHILGMLQLLKRPPAGLTFKDFWFNAWKHFPPDPSDDATLGPKMGEELSGLLDRRQGQVWNGAFGGGAVSVGMQLPDRADELKTVTLDGGMRVTVLGPTGERLAKLKPVWKKEIEKLGWTPGAGGPDPAGHPEDEDDDTTLGDPPPPTSADDVERLAAIQSGTDRSEANGSSIVLLAEFEGKRVLLTGDALPDDVLAAVRLVAKEEESDELKVACWKLAHHGGEKNTSRELVAAVACGSYLISTSGAKYRHPKAVSVARVLDGRSRRGEAKLLFNYRSTFTGWWSKPERFRPPYAYIPEYPDTEGTLVVDI